MITITHTIYQLLESKKFVHEDCHVLRNRLVETLEQNPSLLTVKASETPQLVGFYGT